MVGIAFQRSSSSTPSGCTVAMGHEKIELTLGTYGHLFPDRVGDREKVAAFEASVLGAPSR